MDEREQQLVEAAMRYVTLLEQGTVVNIKEYVQTVDATLCDDLAEDLELLLALGRPTEPIMLTPEAQDRVERALVRAQVRDEQRLATSSSSLTALRKARGLTVAALARVVDLPVDLMARIERGGVRAATVPPRLLERLGAALSAAEADIARAIAAPRAAPVGVRLSAQDGTTVQPEDAVDFADALAASDATDAQRRLWT